MSKGKAEAVYTKAQLLQSSRYNPQERDILAAILVDGETYTHDQAAKALVDFRKKKVIG